MIRSRKSTSSGFLLELLQECTQHFFDLGANILKFYTHPVPVCTGNLTFEFEWFFIIFQSKCHDNFVTDEQGPLGLNKQSAMADILYVVGVKAVISGIIDRDAAGGSEPCPRVPGRRKRLPPGTILSIPGRSCRTTALSRISGSNCSSRR